MRVRPIAVSLLVLTSCALSHASLPLIADGSDVADVLPRDVAEDDGETGLDVRDDEAAMDVDDTMDVPTDLVGDEADVADTTAPDVPGTTCGAIGQACCSGNACTAGSLICNPADGRFDACGHCGDLGERCCAVGGCSAGTCTDVATRFGTGQFCQDGSLTAGVAGGHCSASTCTDSECLRDEDGGWCVRCGHVGEFCCPGFACDGSAVCNHEDHAMRGVCR